MIASLPQPKFLPTTQAELAALGWGEVDILLIQGDAYLDHPAQGPALLGRWLVAHGFRTGLISQPRWRDASQGQADLAVLGRPRLFAALSAGSMDSLLAHYTAFRKKRSDDALTPGGRSGARPNRATLVYTGLARAVFPGLPILIGGLEASLRRLSHYDFWQDALRRSILLDSKADLLVYGPGERPLLEVARRLDEGGPQAALSGIAGTVTAGPAGAETAESVLKLPSHEAILNRPALLMEATLATEQLAHRGGRAAFQASGARGVLVHPPAEPLTTTELDFLYGLPFTRQAHPGYAKSIPALSLLAASLTTHRGCGGGCSFCSLAIHQGRRVASRSKASIVAEARALAAAKPLALSDVGAATANLWGAECLGDPSSCPRRSCLWPRLCPHLRADQAKWLGLLREVARQPGVKQVRVASGVRYDLALTDEKSLVEFLRGFVGGQLKVAPEHLDPGILALMRKPGPEVFTKFVRLFEKTCGKTRFLIPYLISAFPGSDQAGMRRLVAWFTRRTWRPRQVQAFIPTPGTVAAAMYYAAVDEKGRPLAVPKSDRERLAQHALLTAGLTQKYPA